MKQVPQINRSAIALRALVGQVRYGKSWRGRRAHDDEKGIKMSKRWDVSDNMSMVLRDIYIVGKVVPVGPQDSLSR